MLTITIEPRSMEIIGKIMNSIAAKYNCSIKYNAEFNSLVYSGDPAFRYTIAQETVYLLSPQAS